MKLYKDSKIAKIKIPKKKIAPIALGAGLIITLFSSSLTDISNNNDTYIPKGILFYGNSSTGYFEYCNSNKQSAMIETKKKIDFDDFELFGGINICLGDCSSYYTLEKDLSYNIEDTLKFLENFKDNKHDFNLSIRYDFNVTSIEEIMNNMPVLEKVSGLSIESNDVLETFDLELSEKINEKFPNLYSLELHTSSIEKGAIENLHSLKSLSINVFPIVGVYHNLNIDTDFKKLKKLKKLSIKDRDYNIPIYFTLDEYNELISNGTLVELNDNGSYMNTYFEICDKLDEMISGMSIDENTTINEKINLVCACVLENLEYTTISLDSNFVRESFYSNGYLFPVLHGGNVVCGNYAALTDALLHRVLADEKSEVIRSFNHAWNTIELDEIYHIDTTWMDNSEVQIYENDEEVIIVGETISIIDALKSNENFISNWYMQPKEYIGVADSSGSHNIYDPEVVKNYDIVNQFIIFGILTSVNLLGCDTVKLKIKKVKKNISNLRNR